MTPSYAIHRARAEAMAQIVAVLEEIAPGADLGARDAGSGAPSSVRLETPPPEITADLAMPCFPLAKALRKSPAAIAEELAGRLSWPGNGLIVRSEAAGAYLNFTFQPERFAAAVMADVQARGDRYGEGTVGAGQVAAIDFSAPNIAKPMSVGHLRSTIIGAALGALLRFQGYRTVGINHLGDWGTQFGKVIYAYREWGDAEAMRQDPVKELLRLYVRFHEEEERDPALEDRGREWFRRLEEGDAEAQRLWREFRELSLAELRRLYDVLGVTFDSWDGEAFFEDKMEPVVAAFREKGLAVESEGALVVPLEEQGVKVPLMLRKRDGTSTYATRDLAAALYRIREYGANLIVYVVGAEQRLHFQQLFGALARLGVGDTRFVHVDFGMVTLPEGRMSTRQGRVVFLEDVLEEAISRAKAILEEKEADLPEGARETVARQVGIGAVKYADLSQTRTKNITFSWDRMLSFEGDAAPYLQYTYARTRSILRRAGATPSAGREKGGLDGEEEMSFEERVSPSPDVSISPFLHISGAAGLTHAAEQAVLRRIAAMPDAYAEAAATFYPHVVANELYRLAQTFQVFYREVPVLKADTAELRRARLALVDAVGMVLRTGLGLLGIECPEQM
jgi:arginyl-tRNA synthetase